MDWKKWSEAWPYWEDAGKRVEIERRDGTTVAGKLDVDDFFPDGEGDEVPVFAVIDDAGTKHSFADNERWRFLPTPNVQGEGAAPLLAQLPSTAELGGTGQEASDDNRY